MAKGAGVLPLVRRPMDLLFVVFFVTHIPTSLLVDGQCALPSEYFPQKATELLAFHLETFKDPLVSPVEPQSSRFPPPSIPQVHRSARRNALDLAFPTSNRSDLATNRFCFALPLA